MLTLIYEPRPFPNMLLSRERVVCAHLIAPASFSQRQDDPEKQNHVGDASTQRLSLTSWAGK